MSDTLHHLTGDRIIGGRVDVTAPLYGRTASGYGGKLPTRYRLTLDDGRERRVYAASYGNAASTYVLIRGEAYYLDGDAERMCELMRGGLPYRDAAEALSRELAGRALLHTYDVHR